jgi:tetratricopeptide (TPR) repeat protein
LYIPAVVFALSAILAAAMHRSYEPGMIGDDAHYYLGAVSLASSGSYRNLSHPQQIPERHFLPGYSLILTPFLMIFPESPATARWLNGALTAVALALMAMLALELLPWTWATIACAWMLFQPITGFMSTAMLSEIPYLCLSLGLLLWLIARYAPRERDPAQDESGWRLAALAAVLLALCCIRPVGFSLLVATGIWLWLLGRRREAWVVAATGLLVVGGYLAWARSGGGESGAALYTSEFTNFAGFMTDGWAWFHAVAKKLLYYGVEGTGLFVPWAALHRWGWTGNLAGLLLAGLPLSALVWGSYSALRDRASLLVLYGVAHFGVLLLWPTASIRYLWPLAPVALVLVAMGCERFARTRPRLAPVLAVWALLVVGVGAAGQLALIEGRRPMVLGSIPTESFQWIRDTLEPDAVVAAELPARLTLYTGHASAALGNYDRPDTLMRDLLAQDARYVLLLERQGVQLNVGGPAEEVAHAERARTTALLRDSSLWTPIYANESEGTMVLQLDDAPGRFGDAYSAFEAAQRALQQGEHEGARSSLESALALDPRLGFARFSLAALLIEDDEPERALEMLASTRHDWPSYPLARFHYGKLLLARGETELAREELSAAMALAEATRSLQQDGLVYAQARTLLAESGLRPTTPSPPETVPDSSHRE